MGGRAGSPVGIGAVLGDDHLELAQPPHRGSVGAGGELQEEALLLLPKRVQRLPEVPAGHSFSAVTTFWKHCNRGRGFESTPGNTTLPGWSFLLDDS